eukprot:gene57548-biopygen32342
MLLARIWGQPTVCWVEQRASFLSLRRRIARSDAHRPADAPSALSTRTGCFLQQPAGLHRSVADSKPHDDCSIGMLVGCADGMLKG